MKCVFCQIVKGKLPTKILYENEYAIVIKDIKPKATFHYLVIAKKHIPSLKSLKPEDKDIISHMILLAQKVAHLNKFSGYKIVINVGKQGGQLILHLHLHLISGKIKKLP